MKKKCEVHRSLRRSSCDDLLYMYFFIISSSSSVPGIQSNLSVRTPLYYGQFPMYRQNSHTFSLKNPSVIRTVSNTDNGHKISALGSKFIPT